MATRYLWAVQDSTGREVISWTGETLATAVTATADGRGVVTLLHAGTALAAVRYPGDTGTLRLHRFKADEKLGARRDFPVKQV